ncbi:MAG: hypothetical protein KKA54_05735 [Proteobacteria bacterium]|nr:hypothetical protein [Pseudomonadota bacterium]
MSNLIKRFSIPALLNHIKEYWFLVTIVISTMGSIFYMLVFQVTPFDKYYEIKHRREQVEFHNLIGYSLLEKGHYKSAKTEFERAIDLISIDYDSLNGRYLSELFLAMESPDWNPSIGLTIQSFVKELQTTEDKKLSHIVEKYLGDLNYRIGNYNDTKLHYEKSLSLKQNYIDALFSYGWFNYEGIPDLKKMEQLFDKMAKADIYDCRGFHGLGYALYMQAIKEKDLKHRDELIAKAFEQSYTASRLIINQLNLVMDFGEIARATNPELSIEFHKWGLQILDDPVNNQLPQNASSFGVQLLTRDGYRSLETSSDKRVWINYQLALDYLSLYKKEKKPEHFKLHDNYLNEAKSLDQKNDFVAIYEDQLEILKILTPD